MRHPARHVALAACLVLAGSAADAAPRHGGRHGKAAKKAKHRAKVAPTVELVDDDADDAPAITARLTGTSDHAARRAPRVRDEAEADTDTAGDSDRVALAADADTLDERETLDEAPGKLRKVARGRTRARDWHIAIGPYLWASSVDANVSVGPSSVSTGVDFIQLERHARYGAEVLAEARYGRFSLTGDLMYGVVAVNGATDVGPLMVTIDGSASSVLVDGAVGYRLVGDDHSLLSLEARGGVRYQRTAVSAAIGIAGSTVASPASVDAGRDAVAGARVFVRPSQRFYVSGTVDLGVVGSSNTTWSASADASVRLGSRVLLSLGWRTLAIDRAHVNLVMHGPRAAVQLLF